MATQDTWVLFPQTKTNDSGYVKSNNTGQISIEPQITIAKKIAIVLSIAATLANILSLLAISKTKKKLNANLRLISSLCSADTLVAVILLFYSVDTKQAPLGNTNGHITCLFQVIRALRMGSHLVTLLNLLGLALDHYYAIVKTLHYRVVTNSRKVTWSIVAMWCISMLLGFSDFYIPSSYHGHCNLVSLTTCERVSCSVYDTEHLVFATTFLIFGLMIWLYTSIFLSLQKKNSLLARHHTLKKRRAQGVFTTILLLGTFVACWLPYCLFEISINILIAQCTEMDDMSEVQRLLRIHSQANYCLYDLILLNSLCDPIIYACRMREVKAGYRNLLASMCPQHRDSIKGSLTNSKTRSSKTSSESLPSSKSQHR